MQKWKYSPSRPRPFGALCEPGLSQPFHWQPVARAFLLGALLAPRGHADAVKEFGVQFHRFISMIIRFAGNKAARKRLDFLSDCAGNLLTGRFAISRPPTKPAACARERLTMSVAGRIKEKLITALHPTRLDVINESELHAGHRTRPVQATAIFACSSYRTLSRASRASTATASSTSYSRTNLPEASTRWRC